MKLKELIGRTITEVRPMTANEVTVSGLASGIVIIMSDGRRYFSTGLKSEEFGAFSGAPAIP